MLNSTRTQLSWSFFVGMSVLAFAAVVVTAQAPSREVPPRPARPSAPTVVSPDISSDRRVTFRLYAPNANAVTVNGEWSGGNNVGMTKDAAGIWSVVTSPI